MAKINKAYCLEMDKIVTSSQARVAYLSKENTYGRFHFYCTGCAEKLESVHVMHKGELTSDMRTTHFKIWKRRAHTQPICLSLNNSVGTSAEVEKTSTPKTTKSIIFKTFLLSQINYEIKENIDSENAPDQYDLDKIQKAELSNIDADIYRTSVFQDIINCYNELIEDNIEDQYELHIQGDTFDNTYKSVFVNFNQLNTKFKKLHEQNDNYFKYRIVFGDIFNKRFQDVTTDWNFVIGLDKKYWITEEIDEQEKFILTTIRVVIPSYVLNNHIHLKENYLEQIDLNKVLDKCYLINCTPTLEKIYKNENSESFKYEIVFNISNLNHLHITFKDSKEEDSSE